jgi:hypothetical protein
VIAAIVLWLAAAYRIRGHRPDGGVLRRIMHPVFTLRPLWAASCFGVVYILTGDVWVAGAVAAGEWAGLHLRHAPGQDMGTWAGTVRDDVQFMAGAGALRGASVSACLIAIWAAGWSGAPTVGEALLPALYALTIPAAYWIGWRIPFRVPPLLRGGIEWSELLTGASRALVFVGVFGA